MSLSFSGKLFMAEELNKHSRKLKTSGISNNLFANETLLQAADDAYNKLLFESSSDEVSDSESNSDTPIKKRKCSDQPDTKLSVSVNDSDSDSDATVIVDDEDEIELPQLTKLKDMQVSPIFEHI
jgi:hypothetical protein